MFNEQLKEDKMEYENDFKVVIASNLDTDCHSRVNQLKSLDSFSRSSESLALSVTSIGENPKVEKERRKKKTRSASRGKKEEREKDCDYGVSRDSGESFISGILASVRREGWSVMGESEEERLRLMNMQLESRLLVTSQASEEALREQAQLRCNLEIVQKEAELHTQQLEGLVMKQKQWLCERQSFTDNKVELERRISILARDVEIKSVESLQMKKQIDSYSESITLHEESMLTLKEDIAMKESVIGDLKKNISTLHSQLQLVKLYHENSEYQAERVRQELEMVKNSHLWVDEQLHTVEVVRDQLQSEVQRVRKSLDDSRADCETLDHKNRSLEIRLMKLQDARLHETTQLLFELEQLQKEIICSSEEKNLLEERYATLTEIYNEKVRDLDKERLRSLDLEKQFEELSQEMIDTKDRLRGNLHDLDLLDDETNELRSKVASLEVVLSLKVSEIRALETENAELEKALQDWRAKSEEKDLRISELNEDLTNVRNSLERVSAERDQSTQHIAILRDDCEKVADQFESSRQALLAKEDALHLLEDMSEEIRVQLEQSKAEIEAQNEMIECLRNQKDQVAENCLQLQTSHSLVCQELENLRQSLSGAHLMIAGLEQEILRLNTTNGMLSEESERNGSYLEQFRSDLSQAQERIAELSLVQEQYTDLLERHRLSEAQLNDLASEHQTLKITFNWTTNDLEAKLEERESQLARLVSQKEAIEQTCQKELLAIGLTNSQLLDNFESVKFAHVVEFANLESQYREKLEKSEKEFSQMCQEKIRCELAIASLQEHINKVTDDYNQRLKECRTKILSMEEKSTAYEDYENKSRKLMEELARKKGEIEGLLEEWKKMKNHAGILQTHLAKREANVLDMVEKHRLTIEDNEVTIAGLRNELKKERDSLACEDAAKSVLQRQVETRNSELDSLKRQSNAWENRAAYLETELNKYKNNETLLLNDSRVLRETDEQLRSELERRYNENRELMRDNLKLIDQMEKLKIAEDSNKNALTSLKDEMEHRSGRFEDTKRKQEQLIQQHGVETNQMKSVIKDVQKGKESLTRTAEQSQHRELIASSVLQRLRSEVKRIIFDDEMSSKTVNSRQQFKELYKLLDETEVPIKTTKPLSRISKCIEDLRTQIDSMQEDVFNQFTDEPITNAESL